MVKELQEGKRGEKRRGCEKRGATNIGNKEEQVSLRE